MTIQMPNYNTVTGDDRAISEGTQYSNRVVFLKSISLITGLLIIISVILAAFDVVILAIVTALASLSSGAWIFVEMARIFGKASVRVSEVSGTSREQQEVISNFSHKIREPLNNLVVLSDLLANTSLSEKQKDLVETLIASTNNMVSTVNDLTMQSAGTIASDRKRAIRFDLCGAVRNTIELFNISSEVTIDFVINKSEHDELEIVGDPIVIKQIVLDILNTIGSQSAGLKPRIVIETSIAEKSDEMAIAILVISADKEILTDLSENDSLSLAQKLITYSKGTYSFISAESVSTITIALPFNKAVTQKEYPIPSPKIVELRREEKKKDMHELNVLLVEDNVINQKITFLTLKPLVKNIDTASNGKEALDKIARSDYDLILMDIQMPVMNGLIAAEKIRALEQSTYSHTPIIAITANAMLGDKEKCLAVGIDEYISKPFQPAALIAIIKKFF